MKKLLFLFLLFSFTYAIDIAGCTATNYQELIHSASESFLPLPLIIFTLVLILGIIYMFGMFFSKPQYLLLAKTEFFHLGVSIGILILFAPILAMGCAIVGFAFDSTAQTLIAKGTTTDTCYGETKAIHIIATCYLDMMEKDANRLAETYIQKNIDLQLDASAYVNYLGLVGGVTFAPKAYKKAHAMFVDNLANLFVLPAFISIRMQNLFMEFFIGAGTPFVLQFMLPGAFILRFIPSTRQIGNMLIAFATGLYLIVPLFIALNGATYLYILNPAKCNEYSGLINDKVLGGCESDTNLLYVARLYPQAFLLPNLVVVVFVTFISSINKALEVIT